METAEWLANDFSGPIIFNYVWWILREAQERKLKRLYFLARDGYTLLRVAKLFCRRFQLDIDCRYLYCSRAAIRTPTYFFIGDEAFDLLLLWGYYVSLNVVLSRAGLTADERREVYIDCCLEQVDEDAQLSKRKFAGYVALIRESKVFRRCVFEKSKAAYDDAIGYLKQEQLFDQDTVAIVDSGWTGSIQRSLRQLLEFEGYTGEIIGFYFGMYGRPKAFADGEYLTWFFDAGAGAYRKAVFSNNLFECLLSAPHGMTKGYSRDGSGFRPVLSAPGSNAELERIEGQSSAICRYCECQVQRIAFSDFNSSLARRDSLSRITRYMLKPTEEEAAYYSGFFFCDDVTEAYRSPLAGKEQVKKLRDYSAPRRVWRKLTKGSPSVHSADLFWAYGTAAFLPWAPRCWYRLNVLLCEAVKYAIHPQRIKRLGSAQINRCKVRMDRCDIVSFDIFDTLLYRTGNGPVSVFQLMEPWAEANCGIADFCTKRVAAEQQARRLSSQEDVTLTEIYNSMDIDKKTAAMVMEYEKETERRVLHRDHFIAGLLKYCVDSGKRIILISDMYMGRKFIADVLKAQGITGFHSLYISSDVMKTKATGSLFQYVSACENIQDRGRWLHIGDNRRSDYYVPIRFGIKAFLYCHDYFDF